MYAKNIFWPHRILFFQVRSGTKPSDPMETIEEREGKGKERKEEESLLMQKCGRRSCGLETIHELHT